VASDRVTFKYLYGWMSSDPAKDHALAAKSPIFTTTGFWVVSLGCFAVWWLLTSRLKFWSLEQDKDGSARCT